MDLSDLLATKLGKSRFSAKSVARKVLRTLLLLKSTPFGTGPGACQKQMKREGMQAKMARRDCSSSVVASPGTGPGACQKRLEREVYWLTNSLLTTLTFFADDRIQATLHLSFSRFQL